MVTLRQLCVLALCASTMAACGFEGLIFGELTRGDQVELPPAAPTTVAGNAGGLEGGAVRFLTGSGDAIEPLETTVDKTGRFETDVPGTSEYFNLVVEITLGARQAWGLIPHVPRAVSVLAGPKTLSMGDLVSEMAVLNAETTWATLAVLAKARLSGLGAGAIAPAATKAAVGELIALHAAGDDRVTPLAGMVARLLEAGATATPPLRTHPNAGSSYLDIDVLGTVDYTGDGLPDVDTVAFDAAVGAATTAFEFNACYPSDQIRLVLIADLRAGGLDRNCAAIDPFRWASDEAGKQVFVTGGVHKDTPRCGEIAPPCLEESVIDAASQSLGNWTPNQIPLYDDGTHGDAISGDGLWTAIIDLPYFSPKDVDGQAGAGVRIGYKYTFGFPGQGWTETEEWPGNKRVLELRDLNGDRLIVRQDIFGDETTNKDKANLLSPAKGGCGKVVFPADPSPDFCVNDSVEAMIDSDGDCTLDRLPAPAATGPLTIDCPG